MPVDASRSLALQVVVGRRQAATGATAWFLLNCFPSQAISAVSCIPRQAGPNVRCMKTLEIEIKGSTKQDESKDRFSQRLLEASCQAGLIGVLLPMFEIDPQELKRLAAQAQQVADELSKQVREVSDSNSDQSQDSTGDSWSGAAAPPGAGPNPADRQPARMATGHRPWRELVAPRANEPGVRFFSYFLTVASVLLPFVVNQVIFM